MTQEKKFILKYKGWHDSEAEFFEVIIGDLEEVYNGHDPQTPNRKGEIIKSIINMFSDNSLTFEELDPNLWKPYNDPIEKLWSMEIGELEEFKERLLVEIKKVQKIQKKDNIKESLLEKINKSGEEISQIFLNSKNNISPADLDPKLWDPYQNWPDKLYSLKTGDEVEEFKNKLLAAIKEFKQKQQKKDNQNQNNNKEEFDKRQSPPVHSKNSEPDKLNSGKSQEDRKVSLITKIEELKKEIQVLKSKNNLTAEEEAKLKENENELIILKKELKKYEISEPNSNHRFPISWVVGGGLLAVVGLAVLFIIRKKKRKISR